MINPSRECLSVVTHNSRNTQMHTFSGEVSERGGCHGEALHAVGGSLHCLKTHFPRGELAPLQLQVHTVYILVRAAFHRGKITLDSPFSAFSNF